MARVAQKFGENKVPLYAKLGMKGHNGWDIDAGSSTFPVYASHDGIVTYTGIDSSEGYGVVLRTSDQYDYNGQSAYFKTIYWHLDKNGIKVKVGQKVKIGDLLAIGDNTGASTGAHLHFGLKPIAKGENDWTWYNLEQKNGYFGALDPGPYFNGLTALHYRSVIDYAYIVIQQVMDFLKRRR